MRITLWLMTFLLLFSLTIVPGAGIAGKVDAHHNALRSFSQVLDIVEGHYVNPITKKELIDDSIKGMLEQLDPHSAYLSVEDYKDMQESTSGKFSGIGIEISLENGRLIVVSPIEDTPADKAGLKSGDFILEIDGESTQDQSLMDVVSKIRGTKGSTVVLTILHADSQVPEEIPIVRGTIPILSVKTKELDEGFLYIRLTRFNENTTKELHAGLKEYRKDHQLQGVVLDLRNNPGGLLGQAVSVTDTFIDDGLIVYIQGKEKENRKDFNASGNKADVKAPMVVLINSGSASASEIVAGALQDHARALLIGERSFGKGSVQTVIPLPDGAAMKLTTALYYTPSGRSIQATGIQPDLEIPFIAPTKDDKAALRHRFTVREKDLGGHLENANKKGAQKDDSAAEIKDMLKKDNQLRMGLELVRSLPKISKIQ